MINPSTVQIGFLGLGKLGLDCGEVLARHHVVRGYDVVPRHSDSITMCDLSETINASQWIFIAVPTPHQQGYDGSVPSSHLQPMDFGYDAVMDCLRSINSLSQDAKKIVLISTVLPGTIRGQFQALLDPKHVLIYNPYLIAMGSVKWDMVNPEMVILGADSASCQALQDLQAIYRPIMQNEPRYVLGTWEEAEFIKIFYNTFISVKVGLVNMIQDFAMKIGNVDVDLVTNALADSKIRIMGPKYMTAGMGDAGACHPRDNIALRWLAQEHDIGYDIFDTIMHAREMQARNLADFLCDLATKKSCSIVIHGKTYKPDVPFCVGSYSTLVGYYVRQRGFPVTYVDPLADDGDDVITEVDQPCVVLLAHNRGVTYGYTDQNQQQGFYCEFPPGCTLVDPWRTQAMIPGLEIIHYGNSRQG